ncbi:MAG: sulfotransferase family 2 domain-containing protein [Paracoccus sp. (in: a-proteobacteria)]|uniref:sulfotransferase family 2 domain-containing protein n=1 Tax=Paracoccus sp. TaxID=267 RepID=UPI0026DFF9B1|nr:sulfotransferase family 2 domain-containing protein [Paracoccus sp. (in: a-proteobacteria)]MDO5612637.1 sulfotransferase family 2 domain-containing protein [Paracoccus sp. (in: a-proteobacteria)]
MIISTRHRYIFVHIPKTGGTSLTQALEQRVGRDDIILSDTPKGRARRRRVKDATARGRLWKHATLADIEGLVDPAIYADYLILTIVRNPWDRMVSMYHWARDQRFSHPLVRLAQTVDFDEFIRSPIARPTMARRIGYYLTDSRGTEWPALILRFETLAADTEGLGRRLGLKLNPLPHLKKSARGDYRSYYTAETAGIVAAAAQESVTRFGYSFDAD